MKFNPKPNQVHSETHAEFVCTEETKYSWFVSGKEASSSRRSETGASDVWTNRYFWFEFKILRTHTLTHPGRIDNFCSRCVHSLGPLTCPKSIRDPKWAERKNHSLHSGTKEQNSHTHARAKRLCVQFSIVCTATDGVKRRRRELHRQKNTDEKTSAASYRAAANVEIKEWKINTTGKKMVWLCVFERERERVRVACVQWQLNERPESIHHDRIAIAHATVYNPLFRLHTK